MLHQDSVKSVQLWHPESGLILSHGEGISKLQRAQGPCQLQVKLQGI